MENASKALIIAGAILLAILLISLGIMIFNQAQDTINTSGMSQADVQAFNNKFLKYEGEHKSGSEVKALINEGLSSNSDENNANRNVSFKFKGIKANGDDLRSKFYPMSTTTSTAAISNSGKYKVSFDYNDNGCVSVIYIDQEGV